MTPMERDVRGLSDRKRRYGRQHCLHRRAIQLKVEGRPLARLRVSPDPSTVAMNNASDSSEANSVSSEFLFSVRALTKDPRPNALRLSLSRISIARKLAIGSVVIAVAQTMGVRCFRARAEDVGAEAGHKISTLVYSNGIGGCELERSEKDKEERSYDVSQCQDGFLRKWHPIQRPERGRCASGRRVQPFDALRRRLQSLIGRARLPREDAGPAYVKP